MASSLNGTGVTFSDGTTQSTAAGSPTTAIVLSATAGASVDAVGSYAFLSHTFASTVNAAPAVTYAKGTVHAGSALRYSGIPNGGAYDISDKPAASGTWRVMGQGFMLSESSVYAPAITVYLRIS